MYIWDISNYLCSIIESILPVHSGERSIVFSLEAGYSRFEDSNCLEDYQEFQILVNRKQNYTGVFLRIAKDDWKYYSYHDSCWRSDGVQKIVSEIWFNYRQLLLDQRPNVNVHEINSQVYIRPARFEKFIEFYNTVHAEGLKEQCARRRVVTKFEPCVA